MKITIEQIQIIEKEMLKETLDILKRNGVTFYMCCGSVLGAVRHKGPIPWDTDMDILIPLPQLEKARRCLYNELSERFCIDDLENNKGYKNFFPRVAMPHTSSDTLHIDLFPIMGLPSDSEKQLKICREIAKRQRVFIRLKHMRSNISHPNFLKNIAGRLIEIFCSPFSKKQLTDQFYRLISEYGYDGAEYVMNACGHYGAKNIFKKQVFGTPVTVPYCDIEVPLPEQYDFYLKRYYNDYMSLPPKEERDSWLGFTLDIDDRDYASVEGVLNNEQK